MGIPKKTTLPTIPSTGTPGRHRQRQRPPAHPLKSPRPFPPTRRGQCITSRRALPPRTTARRRTSSGPGGGGGADGALIRVYIHRYTGLMHLRVRILDCECLCPSSPHGAHSPIPVAPPPHRSGPVVTCGPNRFPCTHRRPHHHCPLTRSPPALSLLGAPLGSVRTIPSRQVQTKTKNNTPD